MKKTSISWEFILLAVLIVSTVAYLFFHKSDRINYNLPEIRKVNPADITSIEITRGSSSMTLRKTGTTWNIVPPGTWRADQAKIEEMKETIAKLAVTELVSESKDYARYELEENRRAVLKVYSGAKPALEIIVGKAAPTYNHTYVMLPGDDRVYLVSGDLPRLFLAEPDQMRDMLVFDISPSRVTGVEIVHKGKRLSLARREEQSGGEAQEGKDAPNVWKDSRGATRDNADVDGLLAALTKLYCGEYLEDAEKDSLANPETTLVLRDTAEHRIDIFPRKLDRIPALSSQNPSPFVMPDYKYEDILKHLDKIMGK